MSRAISNRGPLSGLNPYGAGNADQAGLEKKFLSDFGVDAEEARNKNITSIGDPEKYLKKIVDAKKDALAIISIQAADRVATYRKQGIPEGDAIILAEQAAYREYKNALADINLQYPQAGLEYAARSATGGALGANEVLGYGNPYKKRVGNRKGGKKRVGRKAQK